jgi:hypothetical protein
MNLNQKGCNYEIFRKKSQKEGEKRRFIARLLVSGGAQVLFHSGRGRGGVQLQRPGEVHVNRAQGPDGVADSHFIMGAARFVVSYYAPGKRL